MAIPPVIIHFRLGFSILNPVSSIYRWIFFIVNQAFIDPRWTHICPVFRCPVFRCRRGGLFQGDHVALSQDLCATGWSDGPPEAHPCKAHVWLVGQGPLKNRSSSIGMMNATQYEWENFKNGNQTTNQMFNGFLFRDISTTMGILKHNGLEWS